MIEGLREMNMHKERRKQESEKDRENKRRKETK